MERKIKNKLRPGPSKKDRISKQCTVTLPPHIYDMLVAYMKSNGLINRSGTIAMIIENSLR
jgi:hypothetical protein